MPNVTVEENVMIPTTGGYELAADIARPADTPGRAPGLLFIPGGGWVTANHEPLKERYGIPMAERGYVCVTATYRIMEQAIWPAAIQDVKAMLRWMRANADYLGIDPERIALGGKSAGGHLSLLAAATNGSSEFDGDGSGSVPNAGYSSRISAVIGVAPASDIREYFRREPLQPYTANDSSEAAITAANPVERVTSDYPPTLLVHGTKDDRVPHQMTMRMFAALEEAGVPADLRLFAHQDHMFDGDPEYSPAIVEAMAHFLDRYVAVPAVEAVAADN